VDMLADPRERCARRHRRRHPPVPATETARVRPRLRIIFTAIKPCVTTVTLPSHLRQRQCPSSPVDASPWSPPP
jgi:hypothetical protein